MKETVRFVPRRPTRPGDLRDPGKGTKGGDLLMERPRAARPRAGPGKDERAISAPNPTRFPSRRSAATSRTPATPSSPAACWCPSRNHARIRRATPCSIRAMGRCSITCSSPGTFYPLPRVRDPQRAAARRVRGVRDRREVPRVRPRSGRRHLRDLTAPWPRRPTTSPVGIIGEIRARARCARFHRQALQSHQIRRIISTVNHRPWLFLRCSRTGRGSRGGGPSTFGRAARSRPHVTRSRSKSP